MIDRQRVVIVVGGGIAGMAAALEAHKGGAKILLLEASSAMGGAAAISGGGVCVAGTSTQRRLGIADAASSALTEWCAWGGPTVDTAWAEQYLRAAPTAVHDHLENLGVQWEGLIWHEGNSVPRWHRPADAGRGLTNALQTALRRTSVELRLECPVTGLSVCPDRVEISTSTEVVTADSVIVATGGFCDDRPRLRRHVPWLADVPQWLCGNVTGARGTGLDLLTSTDVATTHLDAVWVYPVGTPDPLDSTGSRGLVVRGLEDEIWVDLHGRRFHNEDRRGGASGTPALLNRAGSTAFGIFADREVERIRLLDNRAWSDGAAVNDAAASRPGMARDFLQLSQYAWSAETVEQLEAKLPVPAGSLVRNVEHYNARVAGGATDEHGKDLTAHRPMDAGPYHAIQYFPIVQKNLGGIRTDLSARVLNVEDRVVPRVYAAGELTGMAGGHINGASALEGTMLGPSYFSGRVAGAAACRVATSPGSSTTERSWA